VRKGFFQAARSPIRVRIPKILSPIGSHLGILTGPILGILGILTPIQMGPIPYLTSHGYPLAYTLVR